MDLKPNLKETCDPALVLNLQQDTKPTAAVR